MVVTTRTQGLGERKEGMVANDQIREIVDKITISPGSNARFT